MVNRQLEELMIDDCGLEKVYTAHRPASVGDRQFSSKFFLKSAIGNQHSSIPPT